MAPITAPPTVPEPPYADAPPMKAVKKLCKSAKMSIRKKVRNDISGNRKIYIGDSGSSYEMDAIGACFIGGASAYGGSGTVGGAVIGAILLGVINQGMSIIGLNSNWQYVVKGAVLLIAVIFDIKFNNKNMTKA